MDEIITYYPTDDQILNDLTFQDKPNESRTEESDSDNDVQSP